MEWEARSLQDTHGPRGTQMQWRWWSLGRSRIPDHNLHCTAMSRDPRPNRTGPHHRASMWQPPDHWKQRVTEGQDQKLCQRGSTVERKSSCYDRAATGWGPSWGPDDIHTARQQQPMSGSASYLNRPTGHGVPTEDPAEQNSPARHCKGFAVPDGQNVPPLHDPLQLRLVRPAVDPK